MAFKGGTVEIRTSEWKVKWVIPKASAERLKDAIIKELKDVI